MQSQPEIQIHMGVGGGGEGDWLSERYSVGGRYNICGMATEMWTTRAYVVHAFLCPQGTNLYDSASRICKLPPCAAEYPLPARPLAACALHYCIEYPAHCTLFTYAMRLFQLHSAASAVCLSDCPIVDSCCRCYRCCWPDIIIATSAVWASHLPSGRLLLA